MEFELSKLLCSESSRHFFGAVTGAIVGAVVGGLGGKAVAEIINPTAEEAYWCEQYTKEPYYEAGSNYDDYAPASPKAMLS